MRRELGGLSDRNFNRLLPFVQLLLVVVLSLLGILVVGTPFGENVAALLALLSIPILTFALRGSVRQGRAWFAAPTGFPNLYVLLSTGVFALSASGQTNSNLFGLSESRIGLGALLALASAAFSVGAFGTSRSRGTRAPLGSGIPSRLNADRLLLDGPNPLHLFNDLSWIYSTYSRGKFKNNRADHEGASRYAASGRITIRCCRHAPDPTERRTNEPSAIP